MRKFDLVEAQNGGSVCDGVGREVVIYDFLFGHTYPLKCFVVDEKGGRTKSTYTKDGVAFLDYPRSKFNLFMTDGPYEEADIYTGKIYEEA